MIYEKWQSASKTMSTSQPRCAVKDEVELEQHTASSDVKKVERQDKQLTFDGCVTRAFKCGRRRGGDKAGRSSSSKQHKFDRPVDAAWTQFVAGVG